MGEPYAGFSRLYDRIMAHVGYDQWADYVEQLLERYGHRPRQLLDLACGTGNTSIPFARRGYRVTGVDLSREMLDRAREKTAREGLEVAFRHGDMRELAAALADPPPAFDLVLCLYDSLNYVTDLGELTRVFRGVERVLSATGLFIFDVNSAHRLATAADTTTFFEEDDLALVWENRYEREARIWEATLTGFLLGPDGRWERFKEVHRERAYTEAELAAALRSAGLVARGVFAAFSFDAPAADTARLYYVVGRAP